MPIGFVYAARPKKYALGSCFTILCSGLDIYVPIYPFPSGLLHCHRSVTGEFPPQMPVMWSFDIFFDLRLNKRLSEQPWGRWFQTPSHSLWRHCNVITVSPLPYGHRKRNTILTKSPSQAAPGVVNLTTSRTDCDDFFSPKMTLFPYQWCYPYTCATQWYVKVMNPLVPSRHWVSISQLVAKCCILILW